MFTVHREPVLRAFLVHQFSAESVNEPAFLVLDLIRRSAGLERDGNARGFIHPEFDQGEGAAGCGEGMIANPRFDSGCFDAPADDPVGVLPEEGVGGQLTGLAAGAAEEIAVDVVDDAGHFDVIVPDPGRGDDGRERRAPFRKILSDRQIHDRADPSEGVGKRGK
jgi:hypothetical protein